MYELTVVFIVLVTLERIFPATKQPKVKGWYVRAMFFNLLGIPLVMLGQHTWIPFFREHALVYGVRDWPPVAGGLLAFLVFNFFLYWWHRIKHKNQFLWRTLHQMHHSPTRVETLTSYYGHPFDAISNLTLSAFVCWCLLGLDWRGVAAFALIQGIYDYFTHANLKTPYWLGYFIQRPEMHRVHHELEVHNSNFSIPLWDMLFGTHVNPTSDKNVKHCGFDSDKELRLLDMLLCRDVHEPSEAIEPAAEAASTES